MKIVDGSAYRRVTDSLLRFIGISLCILCVFSGSAVAQEAPNVMFIIVDDMSADSLSVASLQNSLGNGESQANSVSTPTLDALARQGMTFTNAYNQGGWSGAVCRTSRTAIMTGRPMWNIPGSDQPNSTVANRDSLPGVFNSAGYDTARFGKSGNDYDNATNTFSTHRETNDRGATASQWFADQGIDYLDEKIQSNDSDPYLLYLGLSHPHDPRNAPESFLEIHGAQNGDPDPRAPLSEYDPLPSAYLAAHPFDNGHLGVRDENSVDGVGQNRDERTIRNEIGKNHAVIEYMDTQLARTIDKALEYEGLTPGVDDISDLQNTLIVFTADHGMSVGRHGLVGKQNVYEHTLRVPYIVAGAVNGTPIHTGVSDENIYLHDSMPTLLELSGIAENPSVQGQSFADALSADQATRDAFVGHEVVYGAYSNGTSNHVQRSVKIEDDGETWKMIHYPQVNRTQLFNLTADPDETDDLSHDPQYSAVMSTLAMTMDEQQGLLNDPAQGELGRMGINIGRGKSATQSSGVGAELALNGAGAVESTLAGGVGGGNSLVRTSPAQTNIEDFPWWEVDLGASQAIGEITLHNTTNSNDSLRLEDIRIEILDEAMNSVYTSNRMSIGNDDWLTFNLNDNTQVGQFVRVTREDNDSILALDEVQVFAPGFVVPEPPQPGSVNIQWGGARNTVDLGDLSLAQAGDIVAAYNGGDGNVMVDGIEFTVNNLPNGPFQGSLQGATTGDADYDSLLNTMTWGGGTDTEIEITGLTVGEVYGVQIWFADARESSSDGRTMTFSSDSGNSVDVIGNLQGDNPDDFYGQYGIGMFVATEESVVLEMSTNDFRNAHYNALVAFTLKTGDFTDASGIVGLPDGILDEHDVDVLSTAMRDGLNDLIYDLDRNGVVTADDFSHLILNEIGTLPGDADLDLSVDFADFLALSQNFGTEGGWAQGDFDQSGDVTFADFLALSQNFGMTGPGSNTQAVPEPNAASHLLLLVLCGCLYRRRSATGPRS